MPNRVFISHCKEDKDLIDTLAQKLLEHFPQEEIFYDAWSMSPGECFMEGMEKGLKDCEKFFLFMSETSLQKPMVRLEWHSALTSSLRGENAFIPVRVDNVSPPALLTSRLYIDMYNRGLPQTVEDMVKLVNEDSTYDPKNIPQFSNLEVEVEKFDTYVEIKIKAKRLVEPDWNFAFWVDDGTKPSSAGMFMTNSGTMDDGRTVFTSRSSGSITPNQPAVYTLPRKDHPVKLEVFHVLGGRIHSLGKFKII